MKICDIVRNTQPGYKPEISKNEDRFNIPTCPCCGWEGTYFHARNERIEDLEKDFLLCPDCGCPLKAYSHEFNTYAMKAQRRFISNAH